MTSKLTKFAQVVALGLALAFTFNCSSGEDDKDTGGSSSSGGGGTSSPSGSGPKGAISTEVQTTDMYDNGEIKWTRTYKYGYEYDNKGNKIKKNSYDKDGEIGYYDIYEYDSKGNNTKETTYYRDRSIMSYIIYEYDSKGNKIKETLYDKDGNVEEMYRNEYDSSGNKIKETGYEDGNISYENEYDSNGIESKTTIYNKDGSIKATYTYTNEVTYTTINSKKLIATQISERQDGAKTKDEYQYDTKGNQTKITAYSWDKTTGSYIKQLENTYVYTYIN